MCVYLQRTDSVLSIPKRLGLAGKVVYKFKENAKFFKHKLWSLFNFLFHHGYCLTPFIPTQEGG